MPGTDGVRTGAAADETLQLIPGEQVLVAFGDAGTVFDALPAAAFDDLLVVGSQIRPERLESVVAERGGSPDRTRMIPVGVSMRDYDGAVRTTRTVHPSDLTGLSIAVGGVLDDLEPGRSWLVVDTVGVLLMYAQRERVARFLHWLSSTLRDRGIRAVYGLPAGTTTEETRNLIAQCVDRRVDLD